MTAKVVPSLFICKHLRGPKYKDYIMLMHTRKYGGVSPTRIASIMRCMFSYKRFPEVEAETSKKAAEVGSILAAATSTSRRVPDDGNTRREMAQWTQSERQKFQAVLIQCSRWEVDYANEFVKSTNCAMKTSNTDSICDACLAVSLDDSLLHAIQKVRLLIVIILCVFISYLSEKPRNQPAFRCP